MSSSSSTTAAVVVDDDEDVQCPVHLRLKIQVYARGYWVNEHLSIIDFSEILNQVFYREKICWSLWHLESECPESELKLDLLGRNYVQSMETIWEEKHSPMSVWPEYPVRDHNCEH